MSLELDIAPHLSTLRTRPAAGPWVDLTPSGLDRRPVPASGPRESEQDTLPVGPRTERLGWQMLVDEVPLTLLMDLGFGDPLGDRRR